MPEMNLGERLRAQRDASYFTIEALAAQLGVHRNTITNWESGKTHPDSNELMRIGSILGCGFSALLGFSDECSVPKFAYRAHKRLHQNADVIAKARKVVRAVCEIEDILDSPLPDSLPRFPASGFAGTSKNEIAAVAAQVRERCGRNIAGPEFVVRVLEHLGVRTVFIKFPDKGLDGLSSVINGVPVIILRYPEGQVERTIFSAFHELGHLVLHPELFTQFPGEVNEERDYETEANCFAGHFLVPSEELFYIWRTQRLNLFDPIQALLILKKTFRVSAHCLYRRASDEGLINVPQKYFIPRLKKLMGIEGKAKMEDLEPEPLDGASLRTETRFETLVRGAFLSEEIGIAKVAELMRVNVEEAMKITNAWGQVTA